MLRLSLFSTVSWAPCKRAMMQGAALALLAMVSLTPSVGAEVVYVIHISVDGLGAILLQGMMQSDTAGDFASFQRFVDEGATTFNARTDYTHTNTLPNHTSMITGRPVLMPTGQSNTTHHGYTKNGMPGANATLHNSGNPNLSYVASVFDVAHDNGVTTGLYASKSKFILYQQSYSAANGAVDNVPPDNGTKKIDTYTYMATGSPSTADSLHAAFMNDLSTAPARYNFVHYRNPDSAGHASGWGSVPYQAAVKSVAGYLSEIFQFVEANSAFNGRTTIVLTSDHGGAGFSHSNSSLASNYTIPFFAWGAAVAAGADLYELNTSSRADPGSARPDYNVQPAPIRNGDVASLVLDLFDLPAVPGGTINANQDLHLRAPTSVRSESTSEVKVQFR